MNVEWSDMVVVGTIARPHGLRGHVIVQPETDFPDERFRPGATVFVAVGEGRPARALQVKDARWHLGRLLVAFEEVDRIEDAEGLGRGEVRVPHEELMPLPPGRFYHHDLVGCEVVTRDGASVGRIQRVEGSGDVSMLVVRGRLGEVLIPLAVEICVDIDVEARRIVVAPPEGLLELNA